MPKMHKMDGHPLVSIIVLTYNQQFTIAQTINSILAQECDFPIEIIIGEDASKDGTRAVCEEYVALHPFVKLMEAESNKGILRNYFDCLMECKGRYVASCAGDDFWHNPLKLKIQTDFLDDNPDYGVVHTGMCNLDINTGEITFRPDRNPPQDWVTDDVYLRHIVDAPTACFRRSLADNINIEEWLDAGFKIEDLPMWIEFARHTKFKYIPERTVTYRIGQISASSGGDIEKRLAFLKDVSDMKLWFYDKYHPSFSRKNIENEFRHHTIRMLLDDGETALFWKKAMELGLFYSLKTLFAPKFAIYERS